MSEALEPKQKTNPQGDPTTSVSAPKAETKKDPHADAKRQKVVTPEYMFLEAPRTKEFITGSEAAKEAIRRSNVDLAIAYPITPQTSIIELLANFCADGELDARFIKVESEHSAMAALIGASTGGVRCFTATSSHGLAYMHEMLHWASGARLPIASRRRRSAPR